MAKRVTLNGQPWLIRLDSYRFYCRPAEGNPLIDRGEYAMLEFKHNDGPASELAEEMFRVLPWPVEPDQLQVRPAVHCEQHGLQEAVQITDYNKGKCPRCVRGES